MKVLFAVRDEKVSLSIVKKYQKEYKEIISYKNVYYFNAILKELQRDKSYNRVIIDEELEEFTSTSYEEKDKFIFNKLDNITDEASNNSGKDIPIILICSDRRVKSEDILVKMFGIGIYNAIIGNDRSTDEVCRLINSPRNKKDAKAYYKIVSKDVDYDPESENDVSEEEMQHILSYFKRLGKNEDKYVECFRKILSQYNENQMRIIIAILPLHVKSVLEELSPEYQKLVSNGNRVVKRPTYSRPENPTSEKLLNANQKSSNGRPIVVPSSLDKNVIKKISIRKPTIEKIPEDDEYEEEFEDLDEVVQDVTETIPEIEETPVVNTPKRRGRPSKKQLEEEVETEPEFNDLDSELDEFEDILPGIDENSDFENNEISSLPELDDEDDMNFNSLPGVDDEEETFEEEEEENNQYEIENVDSLPGIDEDDEEEEENNSYFQEPQEVNNKIQNYRQDYYDYDYTNYNRLLTGDKKVVAFVGTSKNGTSFIVNNIAKILADSGINTAILDATQNKNSFYIYNNNDDRLRDDAATSIKNLIHGNDGGMRVSNNLTVYVEVPGNTDTDMDNVGPILENIAQNHSAVLIDCDFNTPLQYFENAQEIFLVQSMDVLTIQPLTAFLKELKNRDILEQNKLRVIVNKIVKLRGLSPKQIVGGMSNHNNAEMSLMTELFDRNQVVPIEIPFDLDAYTNYLEGIAECNISTNKYPKEFLNILKKLASVIYPLLPAKRGKEKNKKGYQYNTDYSNGFSNSVNNTLNNMKKNY